MGVAVCAVAMGLVFAWGCHGEGVVLAESQRRAAGGFREVVARRSSPSLRDAVRKHRFWDAHGRLLVGTEALRTAIFKAGQRLTEEDKSGAVSVSTQREIEALVKESARLEKTSKGQRALPGDLVKSAKLTPQLQKAWTKGMDALAESLRYFGQYAAAMEKMAKASRAGDACEWNRLIGESNVLAYKGPNRYSEAIALLDDFHKRYIAHVKKTLGFDPGAKA